MSKGKVFIISGPSGSGKDTILEGLFKIYPDLKFSISSTARTVRDENSDKKKYNFISKEEFEQMIDNGEFLEYNVYLDKYYGTPKAPVIDAVQNGSDIIIEVDVNGAEQIKKAMPECVSVFILPPSLKVLNDRLVKRGTDTPEKIEKRMERARAEIEKATQYDYVIINDKIDNVIKDFADIIRVEGFRPINSLDLINKILDK